MSLRFLVTGATGQVGWQLQRTLAPLGEITASTRSELDLADPDAVAQFVRNLAPDVVVNAAAYTAVDKAEGEPELAHTINAVSPGRIASELTRTGGLLIHYSTDYVFDGTKAGPYGENDTTAPLNVYGQSKLDGERLISASGCAHIILRTTWVYDIRGTNFLRTVLRLAREREELRMVGDQHGAPTWAAPLPRLLHRSRHAADNSATLPAGDTTGSFISLLRARLLGPDLRSRYWTNMNR